jgi:hypothetical protein
MSGSFFIPKLCYSTNTYEQETKDRCKEKAQERWKDCFSPSPLKDMPPQGVFSFVQNMVKYLYGKRLL